MVAGSPDWTQWGWHPQRARWRHLWRASLISAIALVLVDACAGVPACERNSDCQEGYCSDGDCKQDCVIAAVDCLPGYFCNIISQCQEGEGGASTSSSVAQGGSGQGGSGQGGGGGQGGANSVGGGAPSSSASAGGASGSLPELSLCANDGDCAAGLACRRMTSGGAKRCSRACSSSSQCPGDLKCMDSGDGLYCRQSDVGRSCTAAPQCNFACLTPANYCTALCDNGADCPNGYGCMPIGSPAVKVCIRAEAGCNGGDTSACVAAAACDLSPNLILGSCTTTCNSAADCPTRAAGLAPWSCDGLCRRPADVFGGLPGGYQPTEWHCDTGLNPVVLCNDAQHIDFQSFTIPPPPVVDCASSFTTVGAAADACVNSCRYQGGCSNGYECVAVGGVNQQRIGLCLPRGVKEPGSGCASNTECTFGYCSAGVCSRDCTSDGLCIGGQACVAVGGPAVEGMPFRRCE